MSFSDVPSSAGSSQRDFPEITDMSFEGGFPTFAAGDSAQPVL
jgi:hypothetical protein